MEYLVPRRAPDGRLVFVAQSRKSNPPPEDEHGYPTIFRVEPHTTPLSNGRGNQHGKGIADGLLKLVRGLSNR